MNVIHDLEALGYVFEIKDGQVHHIHPGPAPDRATVRPLLDDLRQRKDEVIEYLHQRADPTTQVGMDDLPICQKSGEVEDAWWARAYASRGLVLDEGG